MGLEAVTAILSIIISPLVYLLSLLASIILILCTPFIYLGRYLARLCWFPVHILGKFETLYEFLGVALLVGAVSGASLYYIFNSVKSLLDLDSQVATDEVTRLSPTYSQAAGEKLEGRRPKVESPSGGPSSLNDHLEAKMALKEWDWSNKEERGRPVNGLLSHTIIEEDDSSDATGWS